MTVAAVAPVCGLPGDLVAETGPSGGWSCLPSSPTLWPFDPELAGHAKAPSTAQSLPVAVAPTSLDSRQVARDCTLPTVATISVLTNVSVSKRRKRLTTHVSPGSCSPRLGQGCCPEPGSLKTRWINHLQWLSSFTYLFAFSKKNLFLPGCVTEL